MPPQHLDQHQPHQHQQLSLEELEEEEGEGRGIPPNDSCELQFLEPGDSPVESLPCKKNDETSFYRFFIRSNGPPQIILLCLVVAFAVGSTVGVIPAVMTDRYARLNFGFEGNDCASYSALERPQECRAGSELAQNRVALALLVSNGFTFATSALVGSLSDQTGRRVFIIAGLLLALIPHLTLILIQLHPTLSPNLYYTAHCFVGLISFPTIATASISDVMPPHWRAPSFGLILGGFMMGFAFSPMLALGMTHLHTSMVSFGVLVAATVGVVLYFPETLPKQARTKSPSPEHSSSSSSSPKSRSSFLYLISRPFREMMILNRTPLFRLIALLAFFSGMVSAADHSLLIYYAEDELQFNDKDVAKMFAMIGILGVLIQGVVLKLLNDWVGERNVIIISFVFGAVGNFLYGVARTKEVLFLGMANAVFVGMSFPAISATKANNVGPHEQGRVQGALYSVQSLASALGPASLRIVYRATRESGLPGSMFLFASGLYVVATGFAWRLPKGVVGGQGGGQGELVDGDERVDCGNGRKTVVVEMA